MYIVSACLAGIKCKYNGKDNKNEAISKLVEEGKAIPVCPEVLGGLPTPRVPCEIIKDEKGNTRVIDKDGVDRTTEFLEGAKKSLAIAGVVGAKVAILKSNSPSCGCGYVYDGNFCGKLVEGNGVTTDLFIDNGIKVYSDKDYRLDK
ncbi:DUF523 domain-containing protein [Anaerosalibacter sp. Marseille-P3206]|uniref:DUF523 domain-containing protein n=1 Tax=Anaerosalibacter sp. Marseille-P3206 TaxID=1871005 RepID=UPI00098668FC|nr:DUF523 domain-containing protein [Anaerosalibacter sp. Marseille-P3206]